MPVLIAIGTLAVPLLLIILQWVSLKFKRVFDLLAVICAYLVSVTIAFAVQQSISDDTVFTTDVHKVLHNNLFLLSSSYLGLYGLYRFWLGLLREYRNGG